MRLDTGPVPTVPEFAADGRELMITTHIQYANARLEADMLRREIVTLEDRMWVNGERDHHDIEIDLATKRAHLQAAGSRYHLLRARAARERRPDVVVRS